mmetsp:Transcript_35602/g.72196  ORF Transcript_35602/g.72196 Transcript_35602/m.72196 type:complete len:369 (-) Transcript_35602:63-1169(-)
MRTKKRAASAAVSGALCASAALSDAYVSTSPITAFRKRSSSVVNMVYAPPGSGYLDKEDEETVYPDTYEPMMEYPGTMRPGRMKENQAYENLPLADSDPDPVPWPHFQEIEWHHQWEPPHPHWTPMEQFIDEQGRWASVEEEAQMRMDVRRGVRESRELEELEKSGVSTLIVDTDEDDEEEEEEPQLDLGQGIGGLLGGDDDKGAAATADTDEEGEEEEVDDDDDDDTDYLLDLGLDVGDGSDEDEGDTDEIASTDDGSGDNILNALTDLLDMESGDDADTAVAVDDGDVDLDIDLNLDDVDDADADVGDDDDDVTMIGGDGADSGFDTVPLEDYSTSEDMGEEDTFDDGGFDYDEGGGGGGGDMDGW